ncbi:MAG: glutaredoxin-like protein NrdH [Actinomycetota bacterium]|nr:glutaredoxin-like protein NrdH [Actinomycetota bacterium]
MDIITVYTKPGCVQCEATFRVLNKLGADYRSVDISADPVARDYVMSLGYVSVPVVVTPTGSWSGFRPDRIGLAAQPAATA